MKSNVYFWEVLFLLTNTMKFNRFFSRLDPQGLGRKGKQKGVIKPLVLRREAFLMQK